MYHIESYYHVLIFHCESKTLKLLALLKFLLHYKSYREYMAQILTRENIDNIDKSDPPSKNQPSVHLVIFQEIML